MILVQKSPTLWAVFDMENNLLIRDNLLRNELITYILELERDRMGDMLDNYVPELTWEEVLVRLGRISCCDCGRVVIDSYNPSWPLERQRCFKCLSI